jgi:hypothetical protein
MAKTTIETRLLISSARSKIDNNANIIDKETTLKIEKLLNSLNAIS